MVCEVCESIIDKQGMDMLPRRARQSLPRTLPGVVLQLHEALHLLSLHPPQTHDAIRMLDRAVGLQSGVHGFRGLTLSANAGVGCLPIYLVRPVEYEDAARRANLSEMEISRLHEPFKNDSWYIGDVKNSNRGVEYLLRASMCGNRMAKQVLDWLTPLDSKNVQAGSGRAEYFRAIREGDRERAVELGRVIEQRPDETGMMRMGSCTQRGIAANKIGFVLAKGGKGIEKNIEEAVKYYEIGIECGSAAACVNLGLLYHNGEGVEHDFGKARELYEIALERGERNFAPRNLGMLLFHGSGGTRRDVTGCARMLLMGIREGDRQARRKCRKSLSIVLRSWRMKVAPLALRRECAKVVKEGEGCGN